MTLCVASSAWGPEQRSSLWQAKCGIKDVSRAAFCEFAQQTASRGRSETAADRTDEDPLSNIRRVESPLGKRVCGGAVRGRGAVYAASV